MKAAEMDTRPSFQLMKQTDIVSFFHLQMPRWLFSHQKYKPLSLESKVAYSFLLNRFQLSRLNGWVNPDGEVFVIFTREQLAEEMQISYKKAIACFKELVAAGLVWERRVGRGNANQIYLALVELPAEDAAQHNAAPFGNDNTRPAETAHQEFSQESPIPLQPACAAQQDMPNVQVKIFQNGSSAPAETAHQDLPFLHPSYKDKREIDMSEPKKVCLSVRSPAEDRQDEEELEQLLEQCELWVLPEGVQAVFAAAIERLFYSDSFTVSKARLPQSRVRSHLWRLEGTILCAAYHKLRANTEQKVKNSTAYVMTTLFNAIHEAQSDLLVDPFLNQLCADTPPRGEVIRC